MEKDREIIDDESLEKVVGGLFEWYPRYNVMKYTHDDGSVTKHTVLDYSKAWELSTKLHGQFVPEDEILEQLIQSGYVAG